MRKISCLIILILSISHIGFAQNWCGTVEHRESLYKNKPELKMLLDQNLELFNKQVLENSEDALRNNDNYIIPVVFHVIHESGTENISLAQIEDQMRILNEDFARLNPDTTKTPSVFAEYAAATNIEFRLAKVDPDGNCTEGVTRTFSSLTYNARNNVKELIQWPPQNYLNVWVVRTIENFSEDGGKILGFAQFPDQLFSNSQTDGIVVCYDYCGSIESASANYGRTLTHEVGHWLNLIHIWGDDDCGNDYVNDTPTAQEPNYGVCDSNGDASGGNFPWHVGTCSASPNQSITQNSGEMFMNYMDYSDDFCMNMFSIGQAQRMQSALTTYRNELIAESNLISTGTNDEHEYFGCAPISEFKANYTSGCSGDVFNFESNTYNTNEDSISSYEWTFEGGTPSSSNDQDPSVTYNSPGEYSVTLTTTNHIGSSTKTKESYIIISSEEAAIEGPYFESYEITSFPTYQNNSNLNWTIMPTEDPSWQRTNNVSSPNILPIANENNASIRIRSSVFETLGETHTLITPSVDLSNSSAPLRAYFDLAHARRNGNSDDNLVISISNNCGRTWTKRYDRTTDDLTTNGGGNTFFDFNPSANQWSQESVNMNNYAGSSSVMLKIEFTGTEGNWLYIDNFVICETAELSIENEVFPGINIYPNPSKGDVNIDFEMTENANIKLRLRNIYGALIAEKELALKTGHNNVKLKELNADIHSGIYFVEMSKNGNHTTAKIIITD